MNHLKQLARKEEIQHFLTHADNNAIGFFEKQGFTDNITLDPNKWKRFIKYYTDATLTQCDINNNVTPTKEASDWEPCSVCGSSHLTPFMICCDKCDSWCHSVCVDVYEDIKEEWYCPICRIGQDIMKCKVVIEEL